MTDDLATQILADAARCPLAHEPLVTLGGRLSAVDGLAFDALLARAIAQRRDDAALALVAASALAGRPVDVARIRWLLTRLVDPFRFAVAVAAVAGDRRGVLLELIVGHKLALEVAPTAHAAVCVLASEGEPLAREVARELRMLAHGDFTEAERAVLGAVADLYRDPWLELVLGDGVEAFRAGSYAREVALALDCARRPLAELVPARAEGARPGVSGFAIVRPTRRVGRNDPCPCGSGRKYKKCCALTEARRVADPSPVGGRALAEVDHTDLVAALPSEEIARMLSDELATLDIARLSRGQLEEGALALARDGAVDLAQRWASAAEARRAAGEPAESDAPVWDEDELDAVAGPDPGVGDDARDAEPPSASIVGLRARMVREALAYGSRDTARALARGIDRAVADPLLRIELDLIDGAEGAMDALDRYLALVVSRGSGIEVLDVAYIVTSLWPALGLVFARGGLDLVPPEWLEPLLECTTSARDRLHLDPFEVAWDLVDSLEGGGAFELERQEWEDVEARLRSEAIASRGKAREESERAKALARRVRDLEAEVEDLKKKAGR